MQGVSWVTADPPCQKLPAASVHRLGVCSTGWESPQYILFGEGIPGGLLITINNVNKTLIFYFLDFKKLFKRRFLQNNTSYFYEATATVSASSASRGLDSCFCF